MWSGPLRIVSLSSSQLTWAFITSQNPFIAAPRLVFDWMTGRKCEYQRGWGISGASFLPTMHNDMEETSSRWWAKEVRHERMYKVWFCLYKIQEWEAPIFVLKVRIMVTLEYKVTGKEQVKGLGGGTGNVFVSWSVCWIHECVQLMETQHAVHF